MFHRHQFNHDKACPGLGPAHWHAWRCSLWLRIVRVVVVLVNLPLHAQEMPVSEYEVKAVWLLNFARFVEWPAAAFTNAHCPVVVGVLGKDPFGRNLEQALEGKTVH